MRSQALQLAVVLVVFFTADAGAETSCSHRCFDASSSVEQSECLAAELERAQKELDQLVAAALEEWKFVPSTASSAAERARDDEYSLAIPSGLQNAQTQWREFVAADCDAVGAIWTSGTGRRGAVRACQLDHLWRRSYSVWELYLSRGTEIQAPCNPDAK